MKKAPVAGVLVFVGVAALVLVVYFGIQLFRSIPSASEVTGFARDIADGMPTVPEAVSNMGDMVPFGGADTPPAEGTPTTLPGTEDTPAANSEDWLTPGQRSMLATFGIDESELPQTLTPELETCFSEAIGQERVDAIKAGDSPTFIEGAKAVGCL